MLDRGGIAAATCNSARKTNFNCRLQLACAGPYRLANLTTGWRMREYRCIAEAKNAFSAPRAISATSDEDAIEIARGLDMPTAGELWHGQRLVAAIPAAKP